MQHYRAKRSGAMVLHDTVPCLSKFSCFYNIILHYLYKIGLLSARVNAFCDHLTYDTSSDSFTFGKG
jgi:hypothetical protein